jgi:cobalt-zinc-cadmium efflux system protein
MAIAAMTHHHDHEPHDGHPHGLGGHVPAPADFGKAFAIGIALNAAYVVAEAAYGIAANSLALFADAGHNLSDVLALAAAWGAIQLSRRRPSGRYTYGLGSSTILAALVNAVVLLVVTGGIAWEAIRRLVTPEEAAGLTIVTVAAIGIAINGLTALLFAAGR